MLQSPWYQQDGQLANGSASPNTNKNKRTDNCVLFVVYSKNAWTFKDNCVLFVATTHFANVNNKDVKDVKRGKVC